MTTKASIGAGTLLQRGNGAVPEVFTSLGELLDIKGPALSRDLPDATNMGSPNQREEVIPGILKTGTVDYQLQFVRGDVQQTGLIADIKNGTLRNFQIVLEDDPTNPIAFAAYVQKANLGLPVSGKKTLDISLKISGDFTGL
jgi:hypothetical protein